MAKPMASQETITSGTETVGAIITNDRGHEAYAVGGEYLATYATIKEARKAVFDRHMESARESAE